MENDVQEPAPKYNYITPEEYLEMERKSQYKHEYYDGQVIAMSGARMAHNRILSNLITQIGPYLEGKDCSILPSDMRVSTPNHNSYMYPDATIVCEEPQLEDEQFDTLLNPVVIFEILSLSTKNFDKGEKFSYYRHIPSFREYIMIDSTKKFIEAARKQADGSWQFEEITKPDASLIIRSIRYMLPLEKIYYRTGL